jgi:cell fate (sporulation/competence/biofilm development) regulator YmcA (YheA/YmcA/DUF963 family)
MTNLEETLQQLQAQLLALPEVREFFSLRDAIGQDPFLIEQQRLMKHHQKLMMQTLTDQVIYQSHKQAYDHHAQLFNDHPLVQNYQHCKETIAPLLESLKAIIE